MCSTDPHPPSYRRWLKIAASQKTRISPTISHETRSTECHVSVLLIVKVIKDCSLWRGKTFRPSCAAVILDIIKIGMRSPRPFAGVSADYTIHSKWPSLDRVYTDTSDG